MSEQGKSTRPLPPDAWRRYTIEIDVLIPCWDDRDDDGHPVVTVEAPDYEQFPWKVCGEGIDRAARWDIEQHFQSEREDEDAKEREAARERAEDLRHDRGDWEYEQAKDRKATRRWNDEHGLPTVEGAKAMFEAIDNADEARRK